VKIYNITEENELEEFKVFRLKDSSNYAKKVIKNLNKQNPESHISPAVKHINFERFVIEKD
jgi:hypothetical protein